MDHHARPSGMLSPARDMIMIMLRAGDNIMLPRSRHQEEGINEMIGRVAGGKHFRVWRGRRDLRRLVPVLAAADPRGGQLPPYSANV